MLSKHIEILQLKALRKRNVLLFMPIFFQACKEAVHLVAMIRNQYTVCLLLTDTSSFNSLSFWGVLFTQQWSYQESIQNRVIYFLKVGQKFSLATSRQCPIKELWATMQKNCSLSDLADQLLYLSWRRDLQKLPAHLPQPFYVLYANVSLGTCSCVSKEM